MSTVVSRKEKAESSGLSLTGVVNISKKTIHKTGAIAIFLVLWELAVNFAWVNPIIIPRPTVILSKGLELIASGELPNNILISLVRVALGFGLAMAIALPLGFMLGGWFKWFEDAINPLLQVLGQANPFTLLPVFIVLLGLGEESKIAIILWVCVWPALFNTVTGIRNVDPTLVKMARSVGLGKLEMFYKVLLPASLPTVFTGIRMSAVFAFFMLIGAEMIGARSGLGFMIIQAQAVFNMPKMFVGIVTVAILGILISYLLTYVERRISARKEEITI
jgi:ABC-type nitrate/sulfonate/bicarbonate transport system, permease component